ncbi:hypothetical protein HGRIS_003922 [Hohenbuehelia grisea]|uniref:Uncharacterized protein n=1 Tax=Hohenbuehelia grisea TaxID=104357 RepID=A0ABR3JHE5_9AGAR
MLSPVSVDSCTQVEQGMARLLTIPCPDSPPVSPVPSADHLPRIPDTYVDENHTYRPNRGRRSRRNPSHTRRVPDHVPDGDMPDGWGEDARVPIVEHGFYSGEPSRQDEPYTSVNPWGRRGPRRPPSGVQPQAVHSSPTVVEGPPASNPLSPSVYLQLSPNTPSQHISGNQPNGLTRPPSTFQPLTPQPGQWGPDPSGPELRPIPLPQSKPTPGAYAPQNPLPGGDAWHLPQPEDSARYGADPHIPIPFNFPVGGHDSDSSEGPYGRTVDDWQPPERNQQHSSVYPWSWNRHEQPIPAPIITNPVNQHSSVYPWGWNRHEQPMSVPIIPNPVYGAPDWQPGPPVLPSMPQSQPPYGNPIPQVVISVPQRSIFSRIYLFFYNILDHLYLHFLLRMPSLYFTRVARVVDDAELSQEDIQNMALTTDAGTYLLNWYGPRRQMSPAVSKFRESWDELINSLMEEWRNQNIISVLLLSAVLTMLQIEGIEGDPVSRTATLLSLICALMSLLYGCIYMARFGTMNKMYKAKSWADAAGSMQKHIFWNVWVFLAMPAAWLAWSLVFFSVSVLSFIWRTGSSADFEDPIRLSPRGELGPRVALSVVFVLGLVYFVLIMDTLRHYGSSMDNEWRNKVKGWRLYEDEKMKRAPSEYVPYKPSYEPRSNTPWGPPLPSRLPSPSPSPSRYSPPPQPDRPPGWASSPQDTRWPYRPPAEVTVIPPNPYNATVEAGICKPRAFDEPVNPYSGNGFDHTIVIGQLKTDGSVDSSPCPLILHDRDVSLDAWNEYLQVRVFRALEVKSMQALIYLH